MAKESGLAWTTCSVDDSSGSLQAIINDVTNLEFATPRGVQETTGIDKSAIERLLLLADFSCTLNGVFNDAATTGAHTVLKTAGSFTGNRTLTLVVSGQTLTNETVQTDFAMTRAAGGELTWSAPFVLSTGVVPTWS
jgi:hypothetical protein